MNVRKLLRKRHVPITRHFTLGEYQRADRSEEKELRPAVKFVFNDRKLPGIIGFKNYDSGQHGPGYGFRILFKNFAVSIVRSFSDKERLDGIFLINGSFSQEDEFIFLTGELASAINPVDSIRKIMRRRKLR